ncbi:Leucine-rich repeat-containing protein 56 [Schistosoma japonicum]|nr:Leucine-rich repeat-containing protein 56 [Schistosoma japonicum]KAH8875558.1 Leucine-rich repeat-containing protein 56 [Schistosoma japonicum]
MTEFPTSNDIRPKSALVQITEIHEKTVNPTPLGNQKSENAVDEFLTEQRLRELTGLEDLSMVFTLDLEIDFDRVSAANFGAYLPNLKHMRLSHSNIRSVRDLGACFNNLEVIWMTRCCLVSLDGLSSFANLVELYVAFNGISDLSPCAVLDNIEVLDLEGNLIEDKTSLSFLRLCHSLTSLTLEGNPLVTKCGGNARYRKLVRKELPQLVTLDDIPIQNNPASHSREYDITKFGSEWDYINILLKEIGLLSDRKKNVSSENKSEYHLATGAIIEAGRSTLGLKPTPLLKQKRISQFTRSKNNCVTSTLPRSPSEIINSEVNSDEEGRVSELTTGKIICGGISAALRNRRSSTQTGAVGKPKSACLTSEGKSSVTLPLDKSGGWKSDESLDPNESDMQHADKAVAVECENILKQEFDIQKECDIVFKELAEWRKLHSDSKLFNSNKKVENSKQHLAKRVTGCDADLSSTKSNKTTDSCLNVQHDCRSNIVTSNKPLNNSNQILNGHKNCLVNSIQNQNHKNTVSVEMLSSTGKSQIL